MGRMYLGRWGRVWIEGKEGKAVEEESMGKGIREGNG